MTSRSFANIADVLSHHPTCSNHMFIISITRIWSGLSAPSVLRRSVRSRVWKYICACTQTRGHTSVRHVPNASTRTETCASIYLYIPENDHISAIYVKSPLLRYGRFIFHFVNLCLLLKLLVMQFYLLKATNLRLHLRIHQQLTDIGKTGARVRKPETIHICEFCPMTFSRERHFYVHRCTHTGEKPTLPCAHCSEKFDNIEDLKKHKLHQHPGTVHPCQLCDKSFLKKTAMLRHRATHGAPATTLKPVFHCQHCEAPFTTSASRTVSILTC